MAFSNGKRNKRNIKILSHRDKRVEKYRTSRENTTITISPLNQTNLVFKKRTYKYVQICSGKN